MFYGQAPSFNNAQIYRVYSFIERHGKNAVRDCAVIAVSARAGLRAMEIAALRVGDVADNWEVRETVRLPNGKGHRQFDEVFFTHPDTRQYVGALLEWHWARDSGPDTPLFIPPRGCQFTADNIRKHINRLYEGAEIPGRSHSGRRTFATMLVEAGVNVRMVQKLMRHNSIAQTMTYVDTNPEAMKRAVASI